MPNKVVITPYDPEWPALFAELRARLRGAGSIPQKAAIRNAIEPAF